MIHKNNTGFRLVNNGQYPCKCQIPRGFTLKRKARVIVHANGSREWQCSAEHPNGARTEHVHIIGANLSKRAIAMREDAEKREEMNRARETWGY